MVHETLQVTLCVRVHEALQVTLCVRVHEALHVSLCGRVHEALHVTLCGRVHEALQVTLKLYSTGVQTFCGQESQSCCLPRLVFLMACLTLSHTLGRYLRSEFVIRSNFVFINPLYIATLDMWSELLTATSDGHAVNTVPHLS